MSSELDILKRKLERSLLARKEAEKLLEEKSLALYTSNKKLQDLNVKLETLVEERTRELRQREVEYQTLVESINDVLCKISLNGTITYINPIAKEITGFSQEELLDTNVFEFVPEQLRKRVKYFYLKQYAQKNCLTYNELPILTKEGDTLWLGLNVQYFEEKCEDCQDRLCALAGKDVVFKASDCQYKEIIVVARDISKQKETENLLLQQQDNLEKSLCQQELVSRIALEANATLDFDKLINTLIAKLGQHMDVSRLLILECIGKKKRMSISFEWCNRDVKSQKEDLQNTFCDATSDFYKYLNEGKSYYFENHPDRLEDLRNITLSDKIKSLIIFPLHVKNELFGFIRFDNEKSDEELSKPQIELMRAFSGIISNVFQRKQMEKSIINERDKANRANKAKSEFLANMSHEIRTPMNAILGFSEALYHKLDSPKQKSMINSVLNSGNMLMSLLNDILDLSKIESGSLEIISHPVDLVYILKEIEILFNEKAKSKGIQLRTKISKGFPKVLNLDEIRIKQVIFNLVGNAVKFTEKGYVYIRADYLNREKSKGDLVIEVEDTGIGIPKSQQKLIFNEFSQQSGQSNRKYGGAGLGLAISKRLIEKMNGQISVQSKVGEGSVFKAIIPGVKVVKAIKQKDTTPTDFNNLFFKEAKVLVVDDVPTNIDTIENLLDQSNLIIIRAENGKSALNTLKKMTPDLILMDIRMPDINGYEVARITKTDPKTAHIPVVAYTASILSTKRNDDTSHFDELLFKPIRRSELLEAIMKFLPFEVRKPKSESKNGDPEKRIEITEEIRLALPTIISILEHDLLPVWTTVKDNYILYKIEEFVSLLDQLSEKYDLPFLKAYVNQLKEDLDTLDLESLKTDLQSFTSIIDQVKDLQQNADKDE